jgi:hypothetical protein
MDNNIQESAASSEVPRNRNAEETAIKTDLSRRISKKTERLTRGLAWFSIGLGLAECLAPRRVARIAGLSRRNSRAIQLFGIREITSGIAILAGSERPAAGMWSRVVGDALDLASLGKAFASPASKKTRLGFAVANVAAITALDLICAGQLGSSDGSRKERPVPVGFPAL